MKLSGKAIDGFLARPDPRVRAVLVYGPDAGLVSDRAEALARGVVSDLNDPFRVSDLPAAVVAGHAGRLIDEVTAQSLTGGRRLIWVREPDEAAAASFAALFAAAPATDSLVVVPAGDLGPRSKLRQAFETSALGAALPCYVEDEAALLRVMVELAAAHGLTLTADAQSYLAAHLVGDRRMARSEIEKLAIYAGDRRRVGLEDVQEVIGDSASQLSLDDPVWAAASGDFPALDQALVRLAGEGTAPVGILRAAQRHFQRLHGLQAEVAAGTSPDAAVAAIKPPVFYKLQKPLADQLRRWSLPALRQALDRLTEAELECKRTGMPDRSLCGRVLFQLAAMARARR